MNKQQNIFLKQQTIIQWSLLLLIITMLSASCSPKMKMQIENQMSPLEKTEEVLVFGLKNDPPEGAFYVGKLENGGLHYYGTKTNPCDYYYITSFLRSKARQAGANLIKIDHINYTSRCIQLKTSLFHVENTKETLKEYYDNKFTNEDSDYATVHFLRPFVNPARVANANIYDKSGNLINYVVAGFVYHHKIKKEGLYTFKLEGEVEKIELDIKKGKEYFALITYNQGWINSGFKIADITDANELTRNRSLMIEMISKYPKEK